MERVAGEIALIPTFAASEVERALLGCILERPALIARAHDLSPEDFSLSSNRCIFRAMLGLSEAGRVIDLVSLVSQLECHGELERWAA